MENETLIKILAGFAIVMATLIGSISGFFTQWKLKQLDNAQVHKKEKESQKLKFYIPLLRCLYELDDRFIRIFDNLDKDWLDSKYLEAIKQKQGFAINPKEKGYFIISSIYLIGCFFGVTEAIKKGVDTTKLSINDKSTGILNWVNKKLQFISKTKEPYNIFQFDPNITIICRLLQKKEFFNPYISSTSFTKDMKDAHEIHKHIQHSIGEMMLEKDGDEKYRVKSFREFYELYIGEDETFRFWFILIEDYFSGLCNFDPTKKFEKKAEMKNDIRPLRLLAIQFWCRKLMSNISKELELDELNFKTREPEEVLKNADVGDELRKLITTYKLDNSEKYLLP